MERSLKVAILGGATPDPLWMWRAALLASVIGKELSEIVGRRIEPVIGAWDEIAVEQLGATWPGLDLPSIRSLQWEAAPADQVSRVYPSAVTLQNVASLSIPRDRGWNYMDCDAWLIDADPEMGAPAPLKPTAFYCRGLTARYAPVLAGDAEDGRWESYTQAFAAWRAADRVYATHPHTCRDLVSYAGVKGRSVEQLAPLWPGLGKPPALKGAGGESPLVWFISPSNGDDIERGIETLGEYVRLGGLKRIIIAGAGVEALDPRAGRSNPFRLSLARNPELLERISFRSLAGFAELSDCIAGAGRIWSSSYDGEPDAIALGALFGKQVISPAYPQSMDLRDQLAGVTLYEPPDRSALLRMLLSEDRATPSSNVPMQDLSAHRRRLAEGLVQFVQAAGAAAA